ncbi:MAG TPA: glycosyltransferase family 4 protein [Xanthobacteraceae bacterium]|nr:glycosyltransferase family 4 protein [Xanthobacteraceae bacterium]
MNILHVFRAPVGGLFRHVVDLARGQAARGHNVGLIADSTTGGARADEVLAALAHDLTLGISKHPFPRHLGLRDLSGAQHVAQRIAQTGAHVIHGHGAKGGAYARLAAAPQGTIRAYTPHGGSLHYRPTTPLGFIYLGLERLLMPRGDLFLFESAYSRDVFRAKVGTPKGVTRVVHNGIGEADFNLVEPAADATDVLFVGELRAIKGIDVLIEALALLHRQGRRVSATIVGSGPDERALHAAAEARGLARDVRFLPAMPARRAFALGRILIVPSRSESLPYIVLEAAGAGLPVIATDVGGISEIFGADSGRLIPPENAPALATAIATALDNPQAGRQSAQGLRQRVREAFSAQLMIDEVLAAYRQVLRSL